MPDNKEDMIRDALVKEKDEVLKENLERAKNLLFLTEDGGVKFRVDVDDLTSQQQALLYAVGSWFSAEGGFRGEDGAVISADQVHKNTTISSKDSAGTRLNELKKSGYLDSPKRGQYRMQGAMMDKALNEIEAATEVEQDE